MKNVKLIQLVEPLLEWFYKNQRILPWREDKSPYRIWVSEIMLQQTRVEAVKPYFERFMKSFPTINDLADAKEDKLMKNWEGLGYYNRVRNMQKAAKIIQSRYFGKMPINYEQLLELPGIGSYTAGAVGSIAFGLLVPAVDGNVLRILSRIRMDERDILKQSVKKSVEEDIKKILPKDSVGDFNQALMELGATVCIPNGRPKCDECPCNKWCQGYKNNKTDIFPVKKPKAKRKKEDRTVLLITDGNHVFIQKRPDNGLLAGLYEFPNENFKMDKNEVEEWVRIKGFQTDSIQQLEESRHIFSHIEWDMTGYLIYVKKEEFYKENMVSTDIVFEEYSIPSAFSAYVKIFKKIIK